ncbi:MAG: thioredoxin family protein [Halobacteriovoraceae bacterium]|nr:thioredoxin family protein [Halobacteriovoraceae bacterium]
MFKYLKLVISFLLVLNSVYSNTSQNEEVPEILAELSPQIIEINGLKYLTVSVKNIPHWHTYWKNPGDAGLPFKNEFFLNGEPIELNESPWPLPSRFIEPGNLWAYGYENEYTFFYSLPKDILEKINQQRFDVRSTYLICKNICVPKRNLIEGTIEQDQFRPTNPLSYVAKREFILEKFTQSPKFGEMPRNLELTLTKSLKGEGLTLYYSYDNPPMQLLASRNLLTPYPSKLLDYKHEMLWKDNKKTIYGKMEVEWDGEYADVPIELPKDGQFKDPVEVKFLIPNNGNEYFIVSKNFQQFSIEGASRFETLYKTLSPISLNNLQFNNTSELKNRENSEVLSGSLLFYILFAFIGGLILNLMPCVLPVISLKLFGLIVHSDENRKRIFKHNLFYSIGILFTFLVLALVIVIIQSSGQFVGWGFQLQSPLFVSLMIIVLFIFSLNLFDLFHFVTPGGKTIGNIELKEGMVGDFFGGVLATILSTPCSAPFLGTALTFAFTSGPLMIVTIFFFIGIGLAFPFILTGIFPGLVSFLPRPGAWMENLKKFLGISLILTIIWLLDVFLALVDTSYPFMKLITGLALTFFAFYFVKEISKKRIYQILVSLPAIGLFISLYTSESLYNPQTSLNSNLIIDKSIDGTVWERWSIDKMEQMKINKDLVFIDFTAKWCFTCKVNERLVLHTNAFSELVNEKNIKLLLADWTKHDPIIGSWLKEHGMVGVPAYFIQKPDGTLINLGETITINEIRSHIE